MSRAAAITVELVQLVPILTLASSFIVAGQVDLERASALFTVSAALAVVITTALAVARAPLNTVLLGTDLWLLLGAVAFGVPVGPLAAALGRLQGAGLFACVLLTGLVLSAAAPRGFLGLAAENGRRRRAGSLALLLLTAGALAWSAAFVDDIRLGGGLPFIALNVSRRILLRRLGADGGG